MKKELMLSAFCISLFIGGMSCTTSTTIDQEANPVQFTAAELAEIDSQIEEIKALSQEERDVLLELTAPSRQVGKNTTIPVNVRTKPLEVVNTSSRQVKVVVMGINKENNGICRGWYIVEPKETRTIPNPGVGNRVFVHISDGIIPRNSHAKITMAVLPGNRFQVFRFGNSGNPASSVRMNEIALFGYGRGNDDPVFDEHSGMTFQQAVRRGWKMVDFYLIDTGQFILNSTAPVWSAPQQ